MRLRAKAVWIYRGVRDDTSTSEAQNNNRRADAQKRHRRRERRASEPRIAKPIRSDQKRKLRSCVGFRGVRPKPASLLGRPKGINLSGEASMGGLSELQSAHEQASSLASDGEVITDGGVSRGHISRSSGSGVVADGLPVQRSSEVCRQNRSVCWAGPSLKPHKAVKA